MGPSTSRLFAKAGDRYTSASILRAVERSISKATPDVNLAKAVDAEMRGDAEIAEELLGSVISKGSMRSPEALVNLVDVIWSSEATISPGLVELLAAYATEYRATEIGVKLQRAYILSLALEGRYSAAFGALSNVAEPNGKLDSDKILFPILAFLTRQADDVEFLQFGLQYVDGIEFALPDKLANDMAVRFLRLGFPAKASQVLSESGKNPVSPERQLIRAEAALDQDMPRQAMIALKNLDQPEQSRLLAAALWKIGEFEKAARVSFSAGDMNAASRGNWFSNAKNTPKVKEQNRYSAASDITLRLTQTSIQTIGQAPLEHARGLLESGSLVREGVSELLQSFPISSPGDPY